MRVLMVDDGLQQGGRHDDREVRSGLRTWRSCVPGQAAQYLPKFG